jgi:hypothetical protein
MSIALKLLLKKTTVVAVSANTPTVLEAMILFQQVKKHAQTAQDNTYEHSFATDSGRQNT